MISSVDSFCKDHYSVACEGEKRETELQGNYERDKIKQNQKQESCPIDQVDNPIPSPNKYDLSLLPIEVLEYLFEFVDIFTISRITRSIPSYKQYYKYQIDNISSITTKPHLLPSSSCSTSSTVHNSSVSSFQSSSLSYSTNLFHKNLQSTSSKSVSLSQSSSFVTISLSSSSSSSSLSYLNAEKDKKQNSTMNTTNITHNQNENIEDFIPSEKEEHFTVTGIRKQNMTHDQQKNIAFLGVKRIFPTLWKFVSNSIDPYTAGDKSDGIKTYTKYLRNLKNDLKDDISLIGDYIFLLSHCARPKILSRYGRISVNYKYYKYLMGLLGKMKKFANHCKNDIQKLIKECKALQSQNNFPNNPTSFSLDLFSNLENNSITKDKQDIYDACFASGNGDKYINTNQVRIDFYNQNRLSRKKKTSILLVLLQFVQRIHLICIFIGRLYSRNSYGTIGEMKNQDSNLYRFEFIYQTYCVDYKTIPIFPEKMIYNLVRQAICCYGSLYKLEYVIISETELMSPKLYEILHTFQQLGPEFRIKYIHLNIDLQKILTTNQFRDFCQMLIKFCTNIQDLEQSKQFINYRNDQNCRTLKISFKFEKNKTSADISTANHDSDSQDTFNLDICTNMRVILLIVRKCHLLPLVLEINANINLYLLKTNIFSMSPREFQQMKKKQFEMIKSIIELLEMSSVDKEEKYNLLIEKLCISFHDLSCKEECRDLFKSKNIILNKHNMSIDQKNMAICDNESFVELVLKSLLYPENHVLQYYQSETKEINKKFGEMQVSHIPLNVRHLSVSGVGSSTFLNLISKSDSLKQLTISLHHDWKYMKRKKLDELEIAFRSNKFIEKVVVNTTKTCDYFCVTSDEENRCGFGFNFFRCIGLLEHLRCLAICIPFEMLNGLWNATTLVSFFESLRRRNSSRKSIEELFIIESEESNDEFNMSKTCDTEFTENLLNVVFSYYNELISDCVRFEIKGIHLFKLITSTLHGKFGDFKLDLFEMKYHPRGKKLKFHFIVHNQKIRKVSLFFTCRSDDSLYRLEKSEEISCIIVSIGELISIQQTQISRHLNKLQLSDHVCVYGEALLTT